MKKAILEQRNEFHKMGNLQSKQTDEKQLYRQKGTNQENKSKEIRSSGRTKEKKIKNPKVHFRQKLTDQQWWICDGQINTKTLQEFHALIQISKSHH